MSRPQKRSPITVVYRRQAPEEQRRYEAARDAFLAEIVRLILARKHQK
jgi:hypothetical protein